MKYFATIAALGVVLAACEAPMEESVSMADGPDWLSIVDKPLTSGDVTVTLKSDGQVEGSGIAGVWEERDGLYCRTLTAPERFAGTECQVVTLEGDQVTFDNQMGRVSTWTVG